MTPTLPHARAITDDVLARIERDRAILSENITEAVFGKLLYIHATTPERTAPSSRAIESSLRVLSAIKSGFASSTLYLPPEVTALVQALEVDLTNEGYL